MARGPDWRYHRSVLLPAAAISLGLLGLISAYATLSDSSAPQAPTGGPPELRLEGAYPLELGSDGLLWQWIDDDSEALLEGSGVYWLGFRAESLSDPRQLAIEPPDQEPLTVRIPTDPVERLVGPLEPDGTTRLALVPNPGAERAPPPDQRRLAVFLSQPTLSRVPAVALPGIGFFPRETASDGTDFNWLRQNGAIDVVTEKSAEDAVLLATVESAGDRRRSVQIESLDGRVAPVTVEVGSTPREIRFGPFPVSSGHARLVLSSQPGPDSIPGDPRALSVRVFDLRVTPVDG